MPRLKVCGITDAAFAIEASRRGVDYLGLIFAAKSPRRVNIEKAGEIARAVAALPKRPKLAGVFADETLDDILAVSEHLALDIVQLSGKYSRGDVAIIKERGYEVWRLWQGDFGNEDAILLDGRKGNASALAPWQLVGDLKAHGCCVVLAGRIGPENIADASQTGADVIDVSSSLETAPGVKSLSLLDELLRNFRPPCAM